MTSATWIASLGQPYPEVKPRYLIPALFCALVLAYPLSYGPALRIYGRTSRTYWNLPPDVEKFYRPLGWACIQSDLVSRCMGRYVRLWIPPEFIEEWKNERE